MATPYEVQQFARGLVMPFAGVELGGALEVSAATELTANSNRLIYLDATAGPFELKLPASAYEGLTFVICENVDSVNAVTLSGNGYQVDSAASILFNAARRVRCVRFNGSAYRVLWGWN